MNHFLEGVIAGLLAGGIGGYYVARAAFNRATTKVAQYVLAGRPKLVKM